MDHTFRMIACSDTELFALDKNGRVWKYLPARDTEPKHYAFWTRLTDHRAGD